MSRREHKSGFSILEVLIALVVFAIGIGSLLTATGYYLRDISAAQQHARAVRIAEREMAALRRAENLPDDLSEGTEENFSWIATAEEIDPSEFPGMDAEERSAQSVKPAQIQVEVRWGKNKKVRLHGFENFKY
ncbi:prepilin-type N-terminal cleavage/methylation domain-containing protein [Verrucomicrobiota bacterium]